MKPRVPERYWHSFHPSFLKRDQDAAVCLLLAEFFKFEITSTKNCRSFGRDCLPTPGIDLKDVFTSKTCGILPHAFRKVKGIIFVAMH
jgi:hypothetical protein